MPLLILCSRPHEAAVSTFHNRPIRPSSSNQDLLTVRPSRPGFPIRHPPEPPDEVLIDHKRRTRPRQDPQRVRSQSLVKRSETFLSERAGDGLGDVWVDVRGRRVLRWRKGGHIDLARLTELVGMVETDLYPRSYYLVRVGQSDGDQLRTPTSQNILQVRLSYHPISKTSSALNRILVSLSDESGTHELLIPPPPYPPLALDRFPLDGRPSRLDLLVCRKLDRSVRDPNQS